MVNEIVVSNVSKTYRKTVKALSEVSIALRKGESVMLLGPNGAGKTTLIKILSGLLSADGGEILFDNRKFSISEYPAPWFGVALQEIGLWPHLTVAETLEFVGRLYRLRNEVLKKSIARLIEEFRLEKSLKIRVSDLSDGMKRRLNLACALIHHPPVLLLDEPSLGLDIEARLQLWNYLHEIKEKKEIILLVSTHDMEEAEKLGDRIAILSQGKLIANGTPSQLKNGKSSLADVFISLTGRSLA